MSDLSQPPTNVLVEGDHLDPDEARAAALLALAGPRGGRVVCLVFDHHPSVVDVWVTLLDDQGAAVKTGRLDIDLDCYSLNVAVQEGLEAVFGE